MDNNTTIVEFKIKELSVYKKKKIDVYFIKSTDIGDEGEIINIPTLEGEVEIRASNNQYIIIGPCNDIYPIPKKLFELKYAEMETKPNEEIVKIISKLGWNVQTLRKGVQLKDSFVYAKEVPFDFAVFVKHCNSVIYGKAGDFYAVTYEDLDNRYIINSKVMKETYELID